jgi:Baseplate J-like protein
MKTYILQLEPNDDITSVKDKMGWGKSSRILVVWPKNEQILSQRLDLILLRRHAAALGTQLALVVRNARIRYTALRLGIPVFTSLSKAQDAAWRLPHRFRSVHSSSREAFLEERNSAERLQTILYRPPASSRQLHPLVRFGIFSTSVLSVFLLAALLLPSATIRLTPEINEQVLTIAVRAAPEIPTVQVSGALPVTKTSVVVEGVDYLPASSRITLPDQPAVGEVLFTNLTDQQVEIPAGTVVRSLGQVPQRFEVIPTASIPPGPGQTMSVPVRCLDPGLAGNLPAGSLVGMEGNLGTALSVTNPLPTHEGSERTLPSPTDNDRNVLTKRLKESLQKAALSELEKSLAADDVLIPTSIQMAEILDQDFQPARGLPANELQLVLRARYEAFSVSQQDIQSLIEMVLNLNQPAGYEPIAGTLKITRLGEPDFQGNTAGWSLEARRQVQARLGESQAVRLSLGQDPRAARVRLAGNLPLMGAPVIDLLPKWWPRLPYLPLRIRVQVIDSGESPQSTP